MLDWANAVYAENDEPLVGKKKVAVMSSHGIRRAHTTIGDDPLPRIYKNR